MVTYMELLKKNPDKGNESNVPRNHADRLSKITLLVQVKYKVKLGLGYYSNVGWFLVEYVSI